MQVERKYEKLEDINKELEQRIEKMKEQINLSEKIYQEKLEQVQKENENVIKNKDMRIYQLEEENKDALGKVERNMTFK